jgi:cytochrome d ubiquinol oxidase subunit I
VALAAMEGRFESGPRAGLAVIGQPNVAARRLDNPIVIPGALSYLAYGSFHSDVRGLEAFPESDWPDNIELLYYAYHIMVGLGTILIAVMFAANLLAWTRRLERSRWMLWILMLAFPFPYIAVIAGWVTAELGRQMRTAEGSSANVSAGTALFTLIGFCGLYSVLSVLFLFLIAREIGHGPVGQRDPAAAPPSTEVGHA